MPIGASGRKIPRSADDPVRQEILRIWFDFQERVAEELGDGVTAQIVMAAGLGRFSDEPLDISSIATITGLSRATVRRRIERLETEGVLEIVHEPNRTVAFPSQHTVDRTKHLVSDLATRLSASGRKIEALRADLEARSAD